MPIFIVVVAILIALFFTHIWRIDMVFRYRMRRNSEVHQANLARIRNHDFRVTRWADTLPYDCGMSYDDMLYDWCKWTYKQFFPEEVK